jgi:hypothetical protein
MAFFNNLLVRPLAAGQVGLEGGSRASVRPKWTPTTNLAGLSPGIGVRGRIVRLRGVSFDAAIFRA